MDTREFCDFLFLEIGAGSIPRMIEESIGHAMSCEELQSSIDSFSKQYWAINGILPQAKGRTAQLIGEVYMELLLSAVILFRGILSQLQDIPGLTPQTVWSTPLTSIFLSEVLPRIGIPNSLLRLTKDQLLITEIVSATSSEHLKAGHIERNKERADLAKPFLESIQDQLDAGYSGNWRPLYNRTIKQSDFEKLSRNIEPSAGKDRAFMSERKLQDKVRELVKAHRGKAKP